MQFMDHRSLLFQTWYGLIIYMLCMTLFYTSVAVWDVVTRVKFNNAIHSTDDMLLLLSPPLKKLSKKPKRKKRKTTTYTLYKTAGSSAVCSVGWVTKILYSEGPGVIIKNTYGRAANITIVLLIPLVAGRL